MSAVDDASRVLVHYGLGGAAVEPLGTGLINETYLVTAGKERFVLQCLNPVFDPAVNLDIDALTRHLEDCGMVTPRLIPSQSGRALWVTHEERHWRLASYVPGFCLDRLENTDQAHHAGRLLGRFHSQVLDFELDLHAERFGVHDTARHLESLAAALDECADHRYYDDIAPLAEAVLRRAASLPIMSGMPDRLVHGDPKISNLVFDPATGEGVCMIDLDTLAHMPVALELGDAMRSWCNPRGEDESSGHFRLDYFAAAMEGYAKEASARLEPGEWEAFVPAATTIMVELAARFTRDALRESYFGWNADKFPDRSTHNQMRARGQLSLCDSLLSQTRDAQAVVQRAFS